MLENAPQEEELHATEKELSPEFIEKVAMDALDKATEECPDPLVHKVMAMTVIHRMIDWHKHVAIRQLEEGNQASMGAWMRDAGKFPHFVLAWTSDLSRLPRLLQSVLMIGSAWCCTCCTNNNLSA